MLFRSDLLIENGRIEKIGNNISVGKKAVTEINGDSQHLIPGCIDDQVHFREPGLTHKGCIASESKAAVAGGITSYMEMPNTIPTTTTQFELDRKYAIAKTQSMANHAFYIGGSNTNIEEVLKTDLSRCCGLKLFLGSSTGTLLVNDSAALEGFFSKFEGLIATHCESDPIIKKELEQLKSRHPEPLDATWHSRIRTREACYASSSHAVALAKKHKTRLHVLHISTERETQLFSNELPLRKKRITAEACVHHLWFSDEDYDRLGNLIKWNPAIKKASDRDGILKAEIGRAHV